MGSFAGPSMTEYSQQANESLLTIVQIETKGALENVGKAQGGILNPG